MTKTRQSAKSFLLVLCAAMLLGLAGCGSDSATSSSSNALPQPSVDCGGSSCID